MAEAPETAASRALAQGDALGALNAIGRAEGASALLLRGIAYAQLGDLELARELLTSVRGEALVTARARAALVELTLQSGEPAAALRDARAASEQLSALGDLRNAALQQLNIARAEVLLGRLAEARHTLTASVPDELRALWSLARPEVAIRGGAAREAAGALRDARSSSLVPALERECSQLERELSLPIARITQRGVTRDADLHAIEAVSDGSLLLVDGCRLQALAGRVTIALARRPVLFALLSALASAWPEPLARDDLIQRSFGVKRVNDSHRARLRVEIGRLRNELADLRAQPEATKHGYALRSEREVASLSLLDHDDSARVSLLLGDGASWSAQSLAEHAGVSKRTVQRALSILVERGAVTRSGAGREVRYQREGTPLASRLLLLGLLPKA